MDEHPAVAQHRVETKPIWWRDRQEVERAGDEHEHVEQEAEDRAQDPRGVGGEAQPQPRACHQRGAAEQTQHQCPVEERALLPAVERRGDERGRRRQVTVLGDVGEREVVGEQRNFQEGGGEEDHRRAGVESPASNLHHQRVLPPAGPERKQG